MLFGMIGEETFLFQTDTIEATLKKKVQPQLTALGDDFDAPVSNKTMLGLLLVALNSMTQNTSIAVNRSFEIRKPLSGISLAGAIGMGEKIEQLRWPVTMAVLSALLVLCVVLVGRCCATFQMRPHNVRVPFAQACKKRAKRSIWIQPAPLSFSTVFFFFGLAWLRPITSNRVHNFRGYFKSYDANSVGKDCWICGDWGLALLNLRLILNWAQLCRKLPTLNILKLSKFSSKILLLLKKNSFTSTGYILFLRNGLFNSG